MQIEPEALYSLFETLIVPIELVEVEPIISEAKEVKEVKDVKEVNEVKRLTMIIASKPELDEEELLNKILTAIQIAPEEIEWIFTASIDEIRAIIISNTYHVVIWGIEIPSIEKYKTIPMKQSKVILSDSLAVIKKDQALKANLWNCLKATFVNPQ